MIFDLSIKSGSRTFHLRCERLLVSEVMERFKVSALSNPGKYIILENDRPLIRDVYRLKHKSLRWTVKEGSVRNYFMLGRVTEMIEEKLEQPLRMVHGPHKKS